MLSRFVALAAVVAFTGLAYGQDSSEGWVRKLSADGKSYVWTLADSSERGASLVFYCDGSILRISTRESLLEMADVGDGQIKVACLSPTHDRVVVDGYLSRNQHGVIFENDGRDEIVEYLGRKVNIGQELTILLSNNDRREIYTFANRNATPAAERALSCKMPKKPKR